MKRLLLAVIAALPLLLLAAVTPPAAAQPAYPNRPIRLILPTPAGGASDACARLVAQALSKSLGQQITIDNKPGAGGALAAQALMTAPADGYTLLWTLSSMSGLPAVQKGAPYQSLAELTPVSLVGHFAYAMFIHPDVPAKTVAEFVEHARARPDQISYATGSLGDYMAATKFLKATGIRSVRVPYRGGSQLLPDLMAGRVQLNFGPLSNGHAQAKEGKLRLLAVLLPQRLPTAPEVPTLAQGGVPSVTLPSWQALFAPPHTPPALAELLSAAVTAALADPALRAQLEQQALQVEASTPQGLAAVAARDTLAWRNFVAEYDIPQE
jgi:tripartite-type tricarboxylate transporter receptor subunit TctC